jgi:resuscitation-promoting factor RpfA
MGAHSLILPPAEHKDSKISASGAFAAVGTALAIGIVAPGIAEAAAPPTAFVSPTSTLDAIAQCESSGNPQASNGTHFGLFQFDLRTWQSVGGSGDPRGASVAEQYTRAQALMNSRGTQPWAASQGCWQGKAGTPVVIKPSPVPRTKPLPLQAPIKVAVDVATPVLDQTVAVVVGDGTHKVIKGDTLSEISFRHGLDTTTVFNLNRHILQSPDLIYPGQVLRLT